MPVQAFSTCRNCGEVIFFGPRDTWVHQDGASPVENGAEGCITIHPGRTVEPNGVVST